MDPVALGRLIGLDRAPEVKTLRRRMQVLAGRRRCEELLMALARHHAAARPEAMGVLYVDRHAPAYQGGADLPRAHLARARIAMAATTDTWFADSAGGAVLDIGQRAVDASKPGSGRGRTSMRCSGVVGYGQRCSRKRLPRGINHVRPGRPLGSPARPCRRPGVRDPGRDCRQGTGNRGVRQPRAR
ncbi:MAG: putative transposase [Acidimicrobiales bacterium]